MPTYHPDRAFHVTPRYTPGHPAIVTESLALLLAETERAAYEQVLAGAGGPEARRAAEHAGLGGIVERRQKTTCGWEVVDLLTGAHERWPYLVVCSGCAKLVRPCHRGRLPLHRPRHGRPCPEGGAYVGQALPSLPPLAAPAPAVRCLA